MVGLKKLTGCLTAGLKHLFLVPIKLTIRSRRNEKQPLVDQPGTFVVLSTLGILVATMYPKGAKWFQIFKK
jgi:hypothetical protein